MAVKKINLFLVSLLSILLVYFIGCGTVPQITKISDKEYNVFVRGGATSSRAELVNEWNALAKKSCNGGEYTVKSGPTTGQIGGSLLTMEGIIVCK